MPIKTGKQYIDSLRDGRRLHIDGKVVTDVTAYTPLQGIIGTIAALHDDQHDPAYRDILTYRSPTTGEPVSTTYLEARTRRGVEALAGCFHLRAQRTFGLMGRLTDFMSAFLVDHAVALRALGKTEAAARAQGMVEHCRENDLQVTHALIDPQSDRSTLDAPSQAVQVVERRADGVVVSGCRMLSTLAPVSNECYVGPYYPRKAGEEKFVAGLRRADECARPLDPGPRELPSRPGRVRPAAQQPLRRRRRHPDVRQGVGAARARDHRRRSRGLQRHAGVAARLHPIQATIRSTMKLRFLAGVATAIARANGRDKLPRFQAAIGELIALVSIAEGIRAGAIAESIRRVEAFARGESRIEGDGISEPKAIGVCGGAAINFFFPYANTKAADVLRLAAGSGVLAMTGADYANPEVGPLMDQWLIGPNIDAKRRLRADEARLGHDRHRVRLARRALRAALLGRSRDQRAALVRERRSPRSASRSCTSC